MRIKPCDGLRIALIYRVGDHICCAVKCAWQGKIGCPGCGRHDGIDRSRANQRRTYEYPEYDTTHAERAQRIWPSASTLMLYGRLLNRIGSRRWGISRRDNGCEPRIWNARGECRR